MVIECGSFVSNKQPIHRPLLIGCSGGSGHNQAIKGIHEFLRREFPNSDLSLHKPVLLKDKPTLSYRKILIKHGCKYLYHPTAGKFLRKIINCTSYPTLPEYQEIQNEIKFLESAEIKSGCRVYVDMLLDVYNTGYEYAAIWNILQRNERNEELKKLIELQIKSDAENYTSVYKYFYDKLHNAALQGRPFTDLISTQAMALPALCNAVLNYNYWAKSQCNPISPILIHQYLTDLPTPGAVHFFKALTTLSTIQQQQIKLYALNLQKDIIKHYFNEDSFAGIYSLSASNNPMVREGFSNEKNTRNDWDNDLVLNIEGQKKFYAVSGSKKIASIMLGSQASMDTFKYLKILLQCKIDKIFVFGGKNAILSKKIDSLLKLKPALSRKIIRLDNQDAPQLSQILSRSNIIIMRSGGMSIMEQMTLKHHSDQKIFLHHGFLKSKCLSSGISWEDENAQVFIDFCKSNNLAVEKTHPLLFTQQIKQIKCSIPSPKRVVALTI